MVHILGHRSAASSLWQLSQKGKGTPWQVPCAELVVLSSLMCQRRRQGRRGRVPRGAGGLENSSPSSTQPVTLLLVGSTGCTKSALGNFFLDPNKEDLDEAETFKVGHTYKFGTKGVKVGERNGIKVIDTAGLNESHERYWENMVRCVRDLRSGGSINVVVLVMRFDVRIDQNWKDTVLYYKKLLGEAFTQSLVIVLNAYKPGSKRYRRGGDPRAANIEMARMEVKKLLNLPAPPLAFAVDSYLEEPSYVELHLKERRDILLYARKQPPTSLADLMVPKTDATRREDELESVRMKAQIDPTKQELQRTESVRATTKERIATFTEDEKQLCQRIADKKKRLTQIDDERVVELEGHRVVIREKCHSLWGLRIGLCIPFSIKTKTPIKKTEIWWEGADSHPVIEVSSDYELSGHCDVMERFSFSRNPDVWFKAEVKVYSRCKDVHKDEIVRLREEVEQLEGKAADKRNERMKLEGKYPAMEAAAEEVRSKLRALNDKIQELERTHLTVEEAERRRVRFAPQRES